MLEIPLTTPLTIEFATLLGSQQNRSPTRWGRQILLTITYFAEVNKTVLPLTGPYV
jgi:hypothetical protein